MAYTLGQIKIDVLKLMRGIEQDFILADIETYEGTEEYKEILDNILPCINRGLIRIKNSPVIPLKTIEVTILTPYEQKRANYTKYSIASISSAIEKIETIELENKDTLVVDNNVEYTINSDTLTLRTIEKYYLLYDTYADFPTTSTSNYYYYDIATTTWYKASAGSYVELTADELEDFTENLEIKFNEYVITYVPKVSLLTVSTENSYDLVTSNYLTEELCSMLAFYIKGELIEEDDTRASILNKNMFESYLNQFKREKKRTKQTKIKESKYY